MNSPAFQDDDDQPMRAALQHDAARVPQPAFDAALHSATVRRLHALADAGSVRERGWLRPALTTAAAVAGLAALVALWPSPSPAPTRPSAAAHVASASVIPRASLLAYQMASDGGDAALFAMLDHDAAKLLPASSPVFAAAPN